jgi:DNA-binding transcriptional LysR family regulator
MKTNHVCHIYMKVTHMNFSQLQCLVAVVDTGSFTEAAYSVNLTQSAISHAVIALERELGIQLLDRNRKGKVALTSVGDSILPHARALLASAAAIEQEAQAACGEVMGKLRLGHMESIIAPQMLAGLLTRFRAAYPEIEVILFEGAMQEVGEWIEQNIVDVGFVVLPAGELESILIATDELCVLLAAENPLAGKRSATPEELRHEGFVMEKTRCSISLLQRAGLEQTRSGPLIRYQASGSATIQAMVREGLGITLVPRMTLPEKLEGMVALSLDPVPELPIGLAVRSQKLASRNARLFMQTAKQWRQEYYPSLSS